jgi:hypothetical protein
MPSCLQRFSSVSNCAMIFAASWFHFAATARDLRLIRRNKTSWNAGKLEEIFQQG